MFGQIGTVELLLIFVVILLVFGPHQIPRLARKLARYYREFSRLRDNLFSQFNDLDFDDKPTGPPPHVRDMHALNEAQEKHHDEPEDPA